MTATVTPRRSRPRPVRAADERDTFVAPTAWGPALLTVQGEDVVAVDPPSRGERRGGTALMSAPAEVRELGGRLAAYVEGDALELASDEQIGRWLAANGTTGFRAD